MILLNKFYAQLIGEESLNKSNETAISIGILADSVKIKTDLDISR